MTRWHGLGRTTIYTDVDVDLDEVVEDIETKDLIKVLEKRGCTMIGNAFEASNIDLVQEAISNIRRGDTGEALLVLERLVEPKWKSPGACLADFAKRKGVQ